MTTRTIDDSRLKELCAPLPEQRKPFAALKRILAFGDLGRWWLDPSMLDLAKPAATSCSSWLEVPRPASAIGSVWVLFVNTCPAELPLLRRAMLLPLIWKPGFDHSSRLPMHLREVASQVVAVLAEEEVPGLVAARWGLHLAIEDDLDLSAITLRCESAWASLAAGLIVAAEGGRPDTDVWATGEWSPTPRQFSPVDGLEAKLALATEYRAGKFFVPPMQLEDARKATSGTGPQLASLDAEKRTLYHVVEPYVTALFRWPEVPAASDEAALQTCIRYYLHQPPQAESTLRFYRSHLLRGVADHCRRQVEKKWPNCKPTHLVTVVSTSPELAALSAAALGVKHRLFLHTDDCKQKSAADVVKACLNDLGERGADCPAPFTMGPSMAEQMIALGNHFLQGVPPGQAVIDLKPGNKKMTYALSRLARPGDWLFNFDGKQHDHRRTIPLTETVDLWQAM
jgi:hypothetical protein